MVQLVVWHSIATKLTDSSLKLIPLHLTDDRNFSKKGMCIIIIILFKKKERKNFMEEKWRTKKEGKESSMEKRLSRQSCYPIPMQIRQSQPSGVTIRF